MRRAVEFAKLILFGLCAGIMIVLLMTAITRYEITQMVKEREWMENKACEYRMKAREQEYYTACYKYEAEKAHLAAFLSYYGGGQK